mgnify:FL=1
MLFCFVFCFFFSIILKLIIRCIAYDIEEKYCDAKAGFRYYYPSRTREDCEAYGYGCQTQDYFQTGLLLNVSDERECAEMGGVIKPLFKWTNATWIGGRMLKTHWKSRELLNPNTIQLTLNFSKFQEFVTLPSKFQMTTMIQNQVSIRFIFYAIFIQIEFNNL